MISLKELLAGADFNAQTSEVQDNLMTLLEKINKVREKWAKPMTVTSGLRTMEHHIEIYKDLAVQRHKEFDMSQVPMKSRHLFGQAVDISDPDGSLYQWTHDNQDFMEEVGLWMEIQDDQKRVHFQIVPPKSGDRWFHP